MTFQLYNFFKYNNRNKIHMKYNIHFFEKYHSSGVVTIPTKKDLHMRRDKKKREIIWTWKIKNSMKFWQMFH
jgi:hypothetical protein